MRQTTKDKMTKTAGIFAVPAIVLYIILTLVFMAYEPDRFETVPNPSWEGGHCTLCYDYVMGYNDWGQYGILDIEFEPKTLQQEVDYMGIGDYMLLVPIGLFFAVCIGLLLFVIIFRGYHSVKNFGHEVIDIWKP
jgi:hypothetical protein